LDYFGGFMVDTVCFDLGNTLVEELKEDKALREDGARNLYSELRLERKIEYEHFVEIHDKIWIEEEKVRLKFREVNVERLITRLLGKLGMNRPDIDHLIDVYFSPKLKYVKLFPDVLDVLEKLRENGYKLVLISNALPSNKLVFKHFKLDSFFDIALFSYEIGLRKPHPDIFHEALERVKSSPEKAIMVGNNPFADIAGSRLVGMKTVLIVRHRIGKEDAPVLPDYIVPSLYQVLDLLAKY